MTSNLSFSPPTRRFLALWLPFLSSERAKQDSCEEPHKPLVIVDKQKNAIRLCALSIEAQTLGLVIGMTLADARARIPDLSVIDADRQADLRLLEKIANACSRFSPLVEMQAPNAVLIDITGCTHLFGDEEKLLQQITRRLTLFHVTHKAAIADTPDAAFAFARFSKHRIIPPGKTRESAAHLPVQALQASGETTTALIRAGLKNFGDLLERPSHVLSARFGEALSRKLQGIAGEAGPHLSPQRQSPPLVLEQVFAEPLLYQEAIENRLAQLLQHMCEGLRARGQGGRMFEAQVFRVDGKLTTLRIETSRSTRDISLLMRLFAERFENLTDPLDPGFGFDAMRLMVPLVETLAPEQVRSNLAGEEEVDCAQVNQLVDKLAIRFGRDHVQHFVSEDSHDPMRAVRTAPYQDGVSESASKWLSCQEGEPPLRPLQMFDPPQPIETLAEVPDGPPIRFRWRRVLHQVARAEGPERFAPEWWHERPQTTRDYYRIENAQGLRFWVFREGQYGAGPPPRWFMQGLFA